MFGDVALVTNSPHFNTTTVLGKSRAVRYRDVFSLVPATRL
jgi:hypothetical protein